MCILSTSVHGFRHRHHHRQHCVALLTARKSLHHTHTFYLTLHTKHPSLEHEREDSSRCTPHLHVHMNMYIHCKGFLLRNRKKEKKWNEHAYGRGGCELGGVFYIAWQGVPFANTHNTDTHKQVCYVDCKSRVQSVGRVDRRVYVITSDYRTAFWLHRKLHVQGCEQSHEYFGWKLLDIFRILCMLCSWNWIYYTCFGYRYVRWTGRPWALCVPAPNMWMQNAFERIAVPMLCFAFGGGGGGDGVGYRDRWMGTIMDGRWSVCRLVCLSVCQCVPVCQCERGPFPFRHALVGCIAGGGLLDACQVRAVTTFSIESSIVS